MTELHESTVALIAAVEQGETIVIERDGEAVAEISPAAGGLVHPLAERQAFRAPLPEGPEMAAMIRDEMPEAELTDNPKEIPRPAYPSFRTRRMPDRREFLAQMPMMPDSTDIISEDRGE